jgi:hypothetical protein
VAGKTTAKTGKVHNEVYRSQRARKGPKCPECGRTQRRSARRKVMSQKRRANWDPATDKCQFHDKTKKA